MGKKGETLQIVVVIPPSIAIKIGTIIKVLPIHQIDRNPILSPGLQDVGYECLAPHGNLEIFEKAAGSEISLPDNPIKGKNEPYIRTQSF